MTELKYTVDQKDIKSVNQRIAIFYVAAYMIVAAAGIAVGAVAVALNAQKMMYILGILLLIMGGALFACAVLMIFTPKEYVYSVAPADGSEYTVRIDNSISVESAATALEIPFSQVTKVKLKKGIIELTVGKTGVLIIKNAIVSGGAFDELFAELGDKAGKLTVEELKAAGVQSNENAEEQSEAPAEEPAEELAEAPAEEPAEEPIEEPVEEQAE